jgi:hypothetical protein
MKELKNWPPLRIKRGEVKDKKITPKVLTRGVIFMVPANGMRRSYE